MSARSRLADRAVIERGEASALPSGEVAIAWNVLAAAAPCRLKISGRDESAEPGIRTKLSARAWFAPDADIRAASAGSPPDRVTVGGTIWLVLSVSPDAAGGKHYALVQLEFLEKEGSA